MRWLMENALTVAITTAGITAVPNVGQMESSRCCMNEISFHYNPDEASERLRDALSKIAHEIFGHRREVASSLTHTMHVSHTGGVTYYPRKHLHYG